MCLNANSSEPLYQQLEQTLKAKIEHNQWHKGDKLPTELELSRQYDVSRITIRKALDSLVKSGYIVRRFEPPDGMDKTFLGLNDDNRIICIERIRSADQVPVSVEISHFKEDFSFLLSEDLTNRSMYDLIRSKHHIEFDCSRKTIEIVFATYELSQYLNVSNGYPLLLICSTLVSAESRLPIGFNRQYILGDRFRLTI